MCASRSPPPLSLPLSLSPSLILWRAEPEDARVLRRDRPRKRRERSHFQAAAQRGRPGPVSLRRGQGQRAPARAAARAAGVGCHTGGRARGGAVLSGLLREQGAERTERGHVGRVVAQGPAVELFSCAPLRGAGELTARVFKRLCVAGACGKEDGARTSVAVAWLAHSRANKSLPCPRGSAARGGRASRGVRRTQER